MDWLVLFKKTISLIIQYLNMSFIFNGHKISVASVIVFVALVSLVMFLIRGLAN